MPARATDCWSRAPSPRASCARRELRVQPVDDLVQGGIGDHALCPTPRRLVCPCREVPGLNQPPRRYPGLGADADRAAPTERSGAMIKRIRRNNQRARGNPRWAFPPHSQFWERKPGARGDLARSRGLSAFAGEDQLRRLADQPHLPERRGHGLMLAHRPTAPDRRMLRGSVCTRRAFARPEPVEPNQKIDLVHGRRGHLVSGAGSGGRDSRVPTRS